MSMDDRDCRLETERLEAELAAMTASAQWYKDEWEKMRKAYAHECDPKLFDRLEAMTARAELAERQVVILAERVVGCPNTECPESGNCVKCRIAWSRAEAEKGVPHA